MRKTNTKTVGARVGARARTLSDFFSWLRPLRPRRTATPQRIKVIVRPHRHHGKTRPGYTFYRKARNTRRSGV